MCNNFDVDAFSDALTNPIQWETAYGIPFGINKLGVGDCNNDGLFDNLDIDCFIELVGQAQCSDGYGAGGGGGDAPEGPDDGWEHFWQVIAWLRAYYGD